jgi:hypothetical protein
MGLVYILEIVKVMNGGKWWNRDMLSVWAGAIGFSPKMNIGRLKSIRQMEMSTGSDDVISTMPSMMFGSVRTDSIGPKSKEVDPMNIDDFGVYWGATDKRGNYYFGRIA